MLTGCSSLAVLPPEPGSNCSLTLQRALQLLLSQLLGSVPLVLCSGRRVQRVGTGGRRRRRSHCLHVQLRPITAHPWQTLPSRRPCRPCCAPSCAPRLRGAASPAQRSGPESVGAAARRERSDGWLAQWAPASAEGPPAVTRSPRAPCTSLMMHSSTCRRGGRRDAAGGADGRGQDGGPHASARMRQQPDACSCGGGAPLRGGSRGACAPPPATPRAPPWAGWMCTCLVGQRERSGNCRRARDNPPPSSAAPLKVHEPSWLANSIRLKFSMPASSIARSCAPASRAEEGAANRQQRSGGRERRQRSRARRALPSSIKRSQGGTSSSAVVRRAKGGANPSRTDPCPTPGPSRQSLRAGGQRAAAVGASSSGGGRRSAVGAQRAPPAAAPAPLDWHL